MATLFPHISFAGRSDIGRKRTNNEDAFGLFPESGIFCVSDGMGGGDDGEVASAATVKAVEDFCSANPLPAPQTYVLDDLVEGIHQAVNGASKWIFRRAQEKNLKGCGATFVGVCFDASDPDEAVALHAGDSRLYRIRGRNIQQITKDHSAAELIGAKNEKDVNPMFRGMILRAVGIQSFVEVECTPLPVKAGDRILICSDGLSRMVPDKKLLSISRANEDVEKAAEAMIAAANDAGGIDNVTAVIVEIGDLPTPVVAVPLPGLQRGGDATSSDSSGYDAGSDTGATRASDSDSGAGFVTCDGGAGAEDAATATNTLATFSVEEGESNMPGAIDTACTRGTDSPQTRDDEHMQFLRAKARRLRRIRFFIRGLSVLLALGVAGMIFLHRQKLAAERRHAVEIAEARKHAQEVEREASERLAREKAEADRNMRIEKQRVAELDAKRKAAAAAAAKETQKAEQAAEAAREAKRKAVVEKQKADAERLARKKAEAEVAELQEANRKAREEFAKLQEANRKAKAKAEAERRAREEAAAKAKAEAERRAREEAAAKAKAEAERRAREEAAAKAKAEAERRAREEAAAKAKAEEERRAREEAAAKAKAEEERRAREEAAKVAADALKKKESEVQRAAESREKEREAALKELIAASEQEPATEYIRKLLQLNLEAIVGDMSAQFKEIRTLETPPERKRALAADIVLKVQASVKQLQDYAAYELEQMEEDLKEADGKRQEALREQKILRLDFCAEAKVFLALSPDTAKAQGQCAKMIREIPRWFK